MDRTQRCIQYSRSFHLAIIKLVLFYSHYVRHPAQEPEGQDEVRKGTRWRCGDVEAWLYAGLVSDGKVITLILCAQALLITMPFDLMPIPASHRPHFLPSFIQCFHHIFWQWSHFQVLQVLLNMLRAVPESASLPSDTI